MAELVATNVGKLYVSDRGTGPVAVFWHSLFVDQRSWAPVLDALGPVRRTVLIDAPNHGRSEPIDHDFTIDDCAVAAGQVLDHLGIADPVDWVGSALGGHVGIVLAATQPERVCTLATIGTPVEPFGVVERWTRIVPLVQLYRFLGPIAFLTRQLEETLIGADTIAAQPDRACTTMAAFRQADRAAMVRAMRCLMLRRHSMRHLLPRIQASTLLLVAAGGQEGWTPADSQAAATTMPNATAATLPGAGHLAPLLIAPDVVAKHLTQLWTG